VGLEPTKIRFVTLSRFQANLIMQFIEICDNNNEKSWVALLGPLADLLLVF